MRVISCLLFSLSLPLTSFGQKQSVDAGQKPVRVAIVGLIMSHANDFLREVSKRNDVLVEGIFEPDRTVQRKYAERYKLAESLFYADLATMLDRVKPEAVAVFTTTYDHRMVMESCASRGIHVMTLEKPLAVNMEHARAIRAAAGRAHMKVIVNYPPTWFPSMRAMTELIKAQHAAGDIRKMVAMDGNPGPGEAGGTPPEFLQWIADPVKAGGGALFDFGCLGANLITWMMDNQRPISVTAILQQIRPHVYPHVDDQATILIEYPKAQGIIQASWNWPFPRKDFEVYGEHGYAIATWGTSLRVRLPKTEEESRTPPEMPSDERNPVSYLAAVVRGRLKISGPSSLENGMIVMEILEAARQSSQTGKKIVFNGE